MKPKPSEYRRRRWKEFPLSSLGVMPGERDMARIRALQEAGDLAGAQRIILDFLHTTLDGPDIRASMGRGSRRKRVVPR